jgi:hypothetical protein
MHLVCYNSCSAFGRVEPLPPPDSSYSHSHELYINQYSSEHPAVAKKRECYSDNLLICFTGFGVPGAFWLAMDANTDGEGPSGVHDDVNTHEETMDELYGSSKEEGELDPMLDFDLPDLTVDQDRSEVVVNHHRNDEWMKNIILQARGNEYSGEEAGDFSERAQQVLVYKYKVEEAIQLSKVPVDQQGYVARKFLKGKIEAHALLIAAKTPEKHLSKGDIFAFVDASIQGTTPGLVTRGEKFVRASAAQIGLDLEKRTGKSPELASVLQEIKILEQARDSLSKFDVLSRLQWYLHLFRGSNVSLRAIVKKARECLKGSITVEQEDPKQMLEQLSHCTEQWVQFWRTKTRFDCGLCDVVEPSTTDRPNGNNNGNGKRPIQQLARPAFPANGQTKGWKGKEVQSGKTYSRAVGGKEPTVSSDPFGVLGKDNLSPVPTDRCKVLWVKNWDRTKMDKLRKAGCCLICGEKGHMVKDCIQKHDLFGKGLFCFRPNI